MIPSAWPAISPSAATKPSFSTSGSNANPASMSCCRLSTSKKCPRAKDRAHPRRERRSGHPFELDLARALVADQRGAEITARLVAGVLGERRLLDRLVDRDVERVALEVGAAEVEGHGSERRRPGSASSPFGARRTIEIERSGIADAAADVAGHHRGRDELRRREQEADHLVLRPGADRLRPVEAGQIVRAGAGCAPRRRRSRAPAPARSAAASPRCPSPAPSPARRGT